MKISFAYIICIECFIVQMCVYMYEHIVCVNYIINRKHTEEEEEEEKKSKISTKNKKGLSTKPRKSI